MGVFEVPTYLLNRRYIPRTPATLPAHSLAPFRQVCVTAQLEVDASSVTEHAHFEIPNRPAVAK